MVRKRLTITLDPQILKRADSYIDGKKIRNRSHAIEYLIKKSFPLKVDQAVVLAGGSGVNFRPLTFEIPTVLIPFKGKPLLAHLIDQIYSRTPDNDQGSFIGCAQASAQVFLSEG